MSNIYIEATTNGWIIRTYSGRVGEMHSPIAVFNQVEDMLKWLSENLTLQGETK